MALKISTAVHKGKAARDKNSARKRMKDLPRVRTKINGELRTAVALPTLTVYMDDTVKDISFPVLPNTVIIEEIFEGIVIDSNYRIMFASEEVSRYETAVSTLLSIYVSVDAPRYKISRERGVVANVPLFTRVDVSEREFVAVLNPLFGVVIHDEKMVIMRRDKRQSRYSVRLENFLRRYKTGRVNVKLLNLTRELNASEVYGHNYGQFKAKILQDAVDCINYNDNGVQITDYGRMSDDKNLVVWFEIIVSRSETS